MSLHVGVSYSAGLDPWFRGRAPADLLEVEPETFWLHAPESERPFEVDGDALARVASLPMAKTVHGIGFPVGGSLPPDPAHLDPLIQTIRTLRPLWVSEHLSFNRFRRGADLVETGWLLPPRQSIPGIEAAVRSIRSVQDALAVPFAVENGVNYWRPRPDEIDDGTFVGEIVERADCGLVLDLHNLWTNQRNGRQSIDAFLDRIPRQRVWEIHLAGGEERRGYWLDGHCDGVPPPLLEIAARIIPALPNLRAIVFEMFPSYLPRFGTSFIADQVTAIRNALPSKTIGPAPLEQAAPRLLEDLGGPDPEVWERAVGRLTLGQPAETPLERELSEDGALALVQELLGEFRASMFASAMPLTCRLLLLTLGGQAVQTLLKDFAAARPPEKFSSSEARRFVEWLAPAKKTPDVAYLSDVVRYELALIDAIIERKTTVVRFEHDPLRLLRSIAARQRPVDIARGDFEIEITP